MNTGRCFTFSPENSFLDALAHELLASTKENRLLLAQNLVFLPTRRACRGLREAFLRHSGGKPLLLPRIIPLGEVAGEAEFAIQPDVISADIPPAMPKLKREFMLARLVMEAQKAPAHVAYSLAIDLCTLLDEIEKEGADLGDIQAIIPETLAKHWQHTLDFLQIISLHWPRILAQEGMVDGGRHQRLMLGALCGQWKNNPPDFPIVAAGSTGSIPAVGELLVVISKLPKGRVILAGLDKTMSDDEWKILAPTHPQYALKQWLNVAGYVREDVKLLGANSPNAHLISHVFAPAAFTAKWHASSVVAAKVFSHIRLLEAPSQHEEARMIAVCLREVLETPEKTAALITPDRTLARMVAAQCRRLGIHIDDSAGTPLAATPPAVFLRLVWAVVEEDASPHSLLALLRHPFASAGLSPAKCREFSRLIELDILRGVRREAGMEALVHAAQKEGMDKEIIDWLGCIHVALKPLMMMRLRASPLAFAEQLQAHLQAAELLASSDEASGAEVLWAKEAGNQLANVVASWVAEAGVIGNLLPENYAPLFETLLANETFRPSYGSHPRLHILSPMEARLLTFDRVILGELNEGVWPNTSRTDPWMSRPMRAQMGLPPEERHIGQSAHDVEMLLHAKEVFLTRAHKMAGKPTVASRWWVRLCTLLEAKHPELFFSMQASAHYASLVALLDAPIPLSALSRPAPNPPLAARPKEFAATEIDKLKAEPYYIYAKKILRLKDLPLLDEEPDQSNFGEIIHRALELFSAQHPHVVPEQAYQILLNFGKQAFAGYMDKPAVKALWWPKFEVIARQWLAREGQLRAEKYESHCEVSSEWKFNVGNENYMLKTRADRVDVFADGSARIIDYKTGKAISAKQVENLKNTQLPLTALALARGSAANPHPTPLPMREREASLRAGEGGLLFKNISSLGYWFTKPEEDSLVAVAATEQLLNEVEEMLQELLAEYQNPNKPYEAQNKKNSLDYNPYDELIRYKEWGQG